MKVRQLLLIFTLLPVVPLAAQSDADRKKMIEFQDRRRQGIPRTPEEDTFFKEFRQRVQAEYSKSHPPVETTGMAPLTELGKGSYKGQQGGLYPEGANTPPAGHRKAGIAVARTIKPLDSEGRESSDGRIVFISIGMSNTTMESQAFAKRLQAEPGIHRKLLFVDCAQSGQVAFVTARPESNYWKVAEDRLNKAGVSARQVQVAWLKEANATPMGGFPDEARKLEGDLAGTVRVMRDRYPNLKIVYFSSRIYGGYALTPLNPEPYAFEGGFAAKWLIARQIAGDPDLKTPWLAWGPYLWADGTKPRADGLSWVRADFLPDGTHPSPSACEKVAKMLIAFLKEEPTAQPWFLAPK